MLELPNVPRDFTPHPGLYGQRWHAMSKCGYYALREEPPQFVALFIPGLYAQAVEIGRRKTRRGAEELCERHTPDFTGCAKGV